MRLIPLKTLALVLTLLVGAAIAQDAPKHGGVLQIATASDPATLNPYVFGNEFDRNAFRPIYDALLEYDLQNYEVVPRLVERYEISEDGLQWTLHLREGVVFHDGAPMTSADVLWSFEQARVPEATRTEPLLRFIDSVEAVDDHTVNIVLSQPDQLLAHTMIDVRVTKAGTIDFNTDPIGTGPFRLVSWDPNRSLTYERNADYWDGDLPYLDGLVFNTVPDGSVQVIQLISGAVDFVSSAPMEQLQQLESSNMIVAKPPNNLSMGFYDIVINVDSPPFNDPRVRQAFSYAIDREAMKRSLFNLPTVQSNPVPVDSPYFAEDALNFDVRDVERAKELLAEAGYPDGVEFDMFEHRTGLEYDIGAQVIQQSAAEAGFRVNIVGVDIGTWVDNVFGQRTFQTAFSAKLPKPVEYDLIAHLWAKTVGAASGYETENPAFYELLQETRSIVDPEEYREAIKELQRIGMESQHDIILAGRLNPAAHAPYVQGFVHQVQGSTIFNSVWLNK